MPSVSTGAALIEVAVSTSKDSRRARLPTTASTCGEVVLDAGCDWDRARQQLTALPGIGPWSAELIAMRGLGDPDAFPVTDLGVQTAAADRGLPVDAPALSAHSRRWRPWRSYVTQHLWATLPHDVNTWPPKEAVA